MSTKNLLKLHEAIAVILLSKPNRTATFNEVAEEINTRRLYLRKDSTALPAYQVMQRTTLSNNQYRHLFDKVGKTAIRLRDSE
jgi:hypothetical protein